MEILLYILIGIIIAACLAFLFMKVETIMLSGKKRKDYQKPGHFGNYFTSVPGSFAFDKREDVYYREGLSDRYEFEKTHDFYMAETIDKHDQWFFSPRFITLVIYTYIIIQLIWILLHLYNGSQNVTFPS